MNLTALQTNGLKLMLTIIQKSEGAPIQAPVIAEAENLKVGYVGKILFKLRKAGLIKALRGKHGGYTLARDAKEITLYELLSVLEIKEFDDHLCPNKKKNADCAHILDCSLRPVLQSIDQYVRKLTSSITLHDLAVDEANMKKKLTTLLA